MRTYKSVEAMHEVARSQWRDYYRKDDSAQEWSDDEIWVMAQATITYADESGIYGEETDGGLRPWFTMEMESYARDTLDGTEVAFEIMSIEQRAQDYEREYLGELPEGRQLWETACQILAWKRLEEDGDEVDDVPIPEDIIEWAREYKEPQLDKSVWQQRLEALVVNNLRDYAHSNWKDGNEEERNRLLTLSNRILMNVVADNEWDEILEEVML